MATKRRLTKAEVIKAAREGDFSSLPRDGTHVVPTPVKATDDYLRVKHGKKAR